MKPAAAGDAINMTNSEHGLNSIMHTLRGRLSDEALKILKGLIVSYGNLRMHEDNIERLMKEMKS